VRAMRALRNMNVVCIMLLHISFACLIVHHPFSSLKFYIVTCLGLLVQLTARSLAGG
jgi:hypothetical protein